jgi:hypothetical protein
MTDHQPAIFVSYAHEDAGLAHTFAKALEERGARVWLDQGELLIGDSLIERIAEAIAEFDFVAALVSEASVESNWCQKEIALAITKGLKRGSRSVTVLPLRVGDVEMPASLADVKWHPLDPTSVAEAAERVVADAVRHLDRSPRTSQPRNVGRNEPRVTQGPRPVARENDELVKITGVDTANVGRPRNDGTRGNALYRIPLLLNRVPPPEWSAAFPGTWNSPPAWTSMHRPGIASISGDRIILDGTSIEELEQYHLKTLRLVVGQLNQAMAEHRQREHARREAEVRAQEEHDARIREALERLNFDDEG